MILVFILVLLFLIVTMFLPPNDIPEINRIIKTNLFINKIDDNLFISDFVNARDYQALKDLGVKQILTVGSELPRHGEQHFRVLHIKVNDVPNENIKKYFNPSYTFIKQAPTLVHCAAGISRSSTILAAYLMRRDQLTADQAVALLRQKRPIVNPNPGFMDQLRAFEKELKNKTEGELAD